MTSVVIDVESLSLSGGYIDWFDKQACKQEFKRILKKDAYVATVWNELLEEDNFSREYMELVRRYELKLTAGNLYFNANEEKLKFFEQDYDKSYYDYEQYLSEDELIANGTSISYTPTRLDECFVEDVRRLFLKYEVGGYVMLRYKTEVCVGQFKTS